MSNLPKFRRMVFMIALFICFSAAGITTGRADQCLFIRDCVSDQLDYIIYQFCNFRDCGNDCLGTPAANRCCWYAVYYCHENREKYVGPNVQQQSLQLALLVNAARKERGKWSPYLKIEPY